MKIYRSIVLALIVCILTPANFAKADKLNLNARCAIAIDSNTKMILYEKNADMIVPMASTTKIMTSLVAIKYGNLDKKFTISKKAASIRGSKVGYKTGEEITLRELLYGLMLRSGNDAAICIAEGIAGSTEKFADLMNEYAYKIGAFNSHFQTPHGLDKDLHYCTAYDLAFITSVAKENKVFNDIVSAKDVSAEQYGFTRSYHNINKILYQIPGADGVKTGYTGKAGKCLVSSVKMNGHDVIFVVLNCTPRWKETKRMYEYVKKNYEYKKMVSKGDVVYSGNVLNGGGKVKLLAPSDIYIPCSKNKIYSKKVIVSKDIKSPILNNNMIGRIEIYCDNQCIYKNYLLGSFITK
ncbi:D-alanyl-D-alanine carboxypeptidase [Clostridium acetobutylicum]|nr:D-alanyl-D-alanine carboxypeptidase [Clostridium acetobutylicum]